MVIQEEDFRLTSIGDSDVLWDLDLLYKVNTKSKDKEVREEFKTAAYGIPITSAMQRVINYRINKKVGENPISMRDYLTEYKLQFIEVKKLLKGL